MGFQRGVSFVFDGCWVWEAETKVVMELRERHERGTEEMGKEKEVGGNGERALKQSGETLHRGTLMNLMLCF